MIGIYYKSVSDRRKNAADLALAQNALEIERGKTDADIGSITTRAAAELVDDLRQDRIELRAEIERLKTKIDEIKRQFDIKHEKIKTNLSKMQLQLYQSQERITALESENELLRDENENLKLKTGANNANKAEKTRNA